MSDRDEPARFIHDVEVVAETILSLAHHPRREAFAGTIGPFIAAGKSFAPASSERAADFLIRWMEFGEDGIPPSEGNIFEPSQDG